MSTVLRNLRIKRVAIVDKGANFDAETGDGAHILLYKRDLTKSAGPSLGDVHVPVAGADDQRDEYEKATLSSATRNALPDAAFAAVWTDASGKKQRKLPYKHRDGSIDLVHLRGALSRIAQPHTQIPDRVTSAARAKLQAAAKEHSVGKQAKTSLLKRLVALISKAEETEAPDMAKAAEDLAALKAHHETLGKVIAGYGDDSKLPADHPVHGLKKLHADMGKSIGEHEAQIAAAAPAMDDGEGDGLDDCDPEDEMTKSVEKRLIKTVTEAVEKKYSASITELKKTADDATRRATELEKAADVEKTARARDVVKSDLSAFRGVSVDLEKDLEHFVALKTANPEAYTRLVATLGAADEQVKNSAMFKNFGTGAQGDGGDAWSKIEALAAKLVEKDGKLTKHKAIEKVCSDPKNAKIVNEYYRSQQ
jgi:hypothetical protein